MTTTSTDRPAPDRFPHIAPTAAELHAIEADELPALIAEITDGWPLLVDDVVAIVRTEQAERFSRLDRCTRRPLKVAA